MSLANNLKQAPLLLMVVVQPFLSHAEVRSLDELLSSGAIELSLTSSGGHSAECITLKATNLSSNFITTRLEPGRTLHPEDEGEQSIIVTQELIFALHPDQSIERQVFGFCFQSLDAGPSYGTTFSLGQISEGSLLDIASYLNAHRDLPTSSQQEAIWVVSDCHPLSSVHAYSEPTEALANYVANSLGLEKPWYTTDHVKTVDELFTRQVERVYGDIPFQVLSYQTLDITILDNNGRVMKRLVRRTNYGPGNYTQPIDLQVKYWPQGEYAIRFEEHNGNVVKEEVFEL